MRRGYYLLLTYIVLSPALLYFVPTWGGVIQSWSMYSVPQDVCTLHFSSAQTNLDGEIFHRAFVERVTGDQRMTMPTFTVLRGPEAVRRFLRIACQYISDEPVSASIQCFRHNHWEQLGTEEVAKCLRQ